MEDLTYEEVDYQLDISCAYNARRRHFYESMDRLSRFVALITTSGAFVALSQGTSYAVWLMLIAAIVDALAFALAPGDHARTHTQLYTRYSTLHADLIRLGPKATDELLRDIQARKQMIESEEPPPRNIVVLQVTNEYAARSGHYKDIEPIPWRLQLVAHLWPGDVTKRLKAAA